MTIEKQIETKHFAEVAVEVTEEDARRAFAAFDALLGMPLELRNSGNYTIPGRTTGEFGYRRRVAGKVDQGRDVSTDTKHVYHFGSHSRQIFENGSRHRMPTELSDFCDVAEYLYWTGVGSLKETVELMKDEQWFKDPKTPSLWPLLFDPFHFLDFHLRFNAYERGDDSQPYIGKRHVDRALLTLGLLSSPGLEFGLEDDGSDAQPSTLRIGSAPFFAGGGWEAAPQEYKDAYPYMRPVVHGVRQTEADIPSETGVIVGHSAVLLANPWDLSTDVPFSTTKPGVLAPAA